MQSRNKIVIFFNIYVCKKKNNILVVQIQEPSHLITNKIVPKRNSHTRKFQQFTVVFVFGILSADSIDIRSSGPRPAMS